MKEGKIDAKALLAKINIVDLIGEHVTLKKKGAEHVGVCPFHDDTTASLNVNKSKQIYKCFACGAGGDGIDFLMRSGYTFAESCKEISGGHVTASGETQVRESSPQIKVNSWTQIKPEAGIDVNEISHYRHGKPSFVWTWHSEDGSVLGYTARFETPEGKDILPFVYATNGTYSEWRWQGLEPPRPLYNLHLIKANPTASIVLVEGEKTADAAQRLLPHAVATTWIGGANGINKTDFSPLTGRKVLLWPDNDFTHKYPKKHQFAGENKPLQEQPGNKAMIEIAALIKSPAAIRYIKNPVDAPCGWDVADCDWTPEECLAYVKANLSQEPPFSPEKILTVVDEVKHEQLPGHDTRDTHDHVHHFKFLGWNKSEAGAQRFNFFSYGSKAIIAMAATSLISPANLLQLAPLNWWEDMFPKKMGFDATAACQWLIHNSNKVGPYRSRYIRGRGAWLDEKRIVIHDGEKLIVNGTQHQLGTVDTKFIYEMSEPLGFSTAAEPLSTSDANKLIKILNWLNWERDVNSYLLAGWCIIAPVCGVLKWRPHIWLTGSAGSGKSWLFKNIIRMLLGETALAVQGETTEPGLRQLLGHDALPVVFDEAEGEDRRSQERMTTVLGLMRASSADDGGILAKGTAGGTGSKTYRIRSCFAFASIGLQVAQQSDRTRVTILSLKGLAKNDPKRIDRWKNLQAAYNETINEEYVARLQARTIKLLPVIVENTRTFANAAAAELGEQRLGDQLGALLAGAYSLFSEGKINYEDAVKWVREKNWNEERSLDGTKDETNLLNFILEYNTTVETAFTKLERSVGELIGIAAMKTVDESITPTAANDKLKRIGVKVSDTGVYIQISNSHKNLLALLKETPWSKNHNKILLRIDGSMEVSSARFSGLSDSTRAVAIPLSLFYSE